jgi:hypothetical protein
MNRSRSKKASETMNRSLTILFRQTSLSANEEIFLKKATPLLLLKQTVQWYQAPATPLLSLRRCPAAW